MADALEKQVDSSQVLHYQESISKLEEVRPGGSG